MQPEDEMDGRGLPSLSDEHPGDADLVTLEAELSAAGARARRMTTAAPAPAFAASLRERLLASHGAAVEVAPPHPVDRAAVALPLASDVPSASGGSSSSRARGLDDPRLGPLPTGPVAHAPAPLTARTSLRTPTILPAPRWTILAAAAALILAVVGLNGNLLFPAPPERRVVAAAGAQLIRAGEATELAAGARLEAGDEIRVSADGSAAVQLGESRIRLAGGSDIRLTTVERGRIAVDQVAGRAWHRVVLPDGGRYVVTTGEVTWTAVGTAFDLERTGSGATGGDLVRELSVEHAVVAEGPGLRVSVDEGHGATVRLGPSPTIETVVVGVATAAADPWIRSNAAADDADGWPLGMLAGLDLAVATVEPTSNVTPRPTGTPAPTATPALTAEPTAVPTAAPTPKPTPRPTVKPTPTPAPTFGSMSISALACPGGVVLGWSVPDMTSFNHVRVLRGTSAEIPAVYPPAGGVIAVDGGYTTDPAKTDGFDPTAAGGNAWYRAVAFDAAGAAIAASVVQGVTTLGVADLGALVVSGTAPGQLTFSWTPFAGSGTCFSFYKLVASVDDPTPSYLEGSQVLAAIGDQGASGTVVNGLTGGKTLWLRLQAVRATSLGKFIAAETAPVQYTVP